MHALLCELVSQSSPCLNLPSVAFALDSSVENLCRSQDTARDSGMLLWVMFLAMDAREPDMRRVAGRLLLSLTDGDSRSLGVLTRSFPPGLLAPSPPDQVASITGGMAHDRGTVDDCNCDRRVGYDDVLILSESIMPPAGRRLLMVSLLDRSDVCSDFLESENILVV